MVKPETRNGLFCPVCNTWYSDDARVVEAWGWKVGSVCGDSSISPDGKPCQGKLERCATSAKSVVTALDTREQIDSALSSGEPLCVVGLNGRGLVQLQLPRGCNYIVLSAEQAIELAGLLAKHAGRCRA